jgi:hypothetical protein
MLASLRILAAGLILMICPKPAGAQPVCEPLGPTDLQGRVNAILSAPTGVEGLERTILLNETLSACERPGLMSAEAANDLARLLDRPELLPYVVRIFNRMGPAAAPVQSRIHRAYLARRRTLRADLEELRRTGVGFTTGPERASLSALRCLDIWLHTGRRVRKYCSYLDY